MTTNEFYDMSLYDACRFAADEGAYIWNEETAKDLIKYCIDNDDYILADHILHFMVNDMEGDWFLWDRTMGTMEEPIDIVDHDALYDYLVDMDVIEESYYRKRKSKIANESRKRRYR